MSDTFVVGAVVDEQPKVHADILTHLGDPPHLSAPGLGRERGVRVDGPSL
ncbi:hypothetical protein ABT063_18230 [Streptomyces sp. NPDC002838]